MEEKNKTKIQIISDAICGIIMILAIVSYIIVGFLFTWHPTWLIVAVSALVCAIIGIVSNTINDYRKLQEKNEKKDN